MHKSADRSRSRSKSRFNIGRTSNRVGVAPTKHGVESDIHHLQEKYTDITKIYNNAIKLATKQAGPQQQGSRRPSRGAASNQRQQDDRRMYGYSGRPQSAGPSRARPKSATAARPHYRQSTGGGGGPGRGVSPHGSGGSGGAGMYKRTLVYSDQRTQVYSSPDKRQTYRPPSGGRTRPASGARPGSASSTGARRGYAAGSGAAAAAGNRAKSANSSGVRSNGGNVSQQQSGAQRAGYARHTASTSGRHGYSRPHSAASGLPAHYRQYNVQGQPVRTRSSSGDYTGSSRRHAGVRTGSRRPPQDAHANGGSQSARGGRSHLQSGGLKRDQSANSMATAPARSSTHHKPEETPLRRSASASPVESSGKHSPSRLNGTLQSHRPQSASYRLQHKGKARQTSVVRTKGITYSVESSNSHTSPDPSPQRKPQGNWTSAPLTNATKKLSAGEIEVKAEEDTTVTTTVGEDAKEAEKNAHSTAADTQRTAADESAVEEDSGAVTGVRGRQRSLQRPDSALTMKRSRDLSEGGMVVQKHAAATAAKLPQGAAGEVGSSSSSLAGLLDNDEDSGEELAPKDGTIGKSKQLGVGSDAVGSKWTAEAEGEGVARSRSSSLQPKPRPRPASATAARGRNLSAVVQQQQQGKAGEASGSSAPGKVSMGQLSGKTPHPGIRSGGNARPKSAVARVQTQGRQGSVDSGASHGARNQVKGPVVTGPPPSGSSGGAVASSSGVGGRKVWTSQSHRSRSSDHDATKKQESVGGSTLLPNESVETMASNPQSAPARGGSARRASDSAMSGGVPPLLCPQASRFCDPESERLKMAQVMQDLVKKQGVSSLEFYELANVLGTGSFAKVREGFHKPTGSRVAVKTYDKAKIKDANQRRRIQQEIRLMEKLNHPRVVRHFEVLETSNRIHLVMECCGGGNLCSYLKRKRRLDEPSARTLLGQILDGLNYMHSLNVVHRDIKLENVLIDEDGSVKLVDFGFSAYAKDKKLKIFCGTPSYMAPEIIKRKEYHGKPVDVWSLGVVLYAMVCGRFPFSGKSYSELYRNILAGQYKLPEQLSGSVRDLLRHMLVLDPAQRWTLAQVQNHAWVKQTPVISKHTPHANKVELVISTDPREDIDETVIKRMATYGVKREIIISCMLRKVHNCVTTTYYLLRSALYNQHLKTSQFAKNVVTAG